MIVPLRRIALLAVTGVSLYLVAPALLDTFSSWQRLRDIWPGAVALIVALEFASLACVCLLQRLALQRPRWLPVVTSQLAGNAAAKIVPGGGAVGSALQYGMLRKAGLPAAATASGLTAVNLLTWGTLLALPLLAVPAILLGRPIPKDLLEGLGSRSGRSRSCLPLAPCCSSPIGRSGGSAPRSRPFATRSCASALPSIGFRSASSASAT